MTVLRSREIKSVVPPVSKNNSPNSKSIKKPRVSSIQPKTPGITRETQSAHASNSSSPMTNEIDASLDRSRSGSVRRSLRLASKNCDDVKKSELCPSVSSESSRKRKIVESPKSDVGVELEDVVVEDSIESDLGGDGNSGEVSKGGIDLKIKVGGVESAKSDGGVDLDAVVVEDWIESDSDSGEVSKGGVELEVVEDSLGSGMEGDLGGDEGSGEVSKKGKGKRKLGLGFGIEGGGDGRGCLRLRSGKKVAARGGVKGFVENVEVLMRDGRGDDDDGEKGGGEENGGWGDLKASFGDEMDVDSGKVDGVLWGDAGSIDDKGKGKLSRKDKGKGKLIDTGVESEGSKVDVPNSDGDAGKKDESQDWKNYVRGNHPTADRYRAIMEKINNGSKGDGVDVWDALIKKCVEGVKANLAKAGKGSFSRKDKGIVIDETVGPFGVGRSRLSGREKGKGKLSEIVVKSEAPGVEVSDSGNVEMQNGVPEAPRAGISNGDNVAVQDGTRVQENDVGDHATRTRDRFRAQARRSASRFAFFSSREEEQNDVVDEAETEVAPRETNSESEDWPGPFSTAMKIIKERVNLQQKNSSSGKETSPVMWVPKQEKNRKRSNLSVPLLQELCMKTLTQNADAIASLDYVPDILRHKLSHMLCNMRRMNSHFLELLVRGSPTEIRIRDCSWLSEEDFTRIFADADISNLAVLQLDQCGRCMPDYILYATLGRSPNCLPLLTTLSLKGACRLSDVGLSSLLSSAPALRSINLCQCSLLTVGGINSIADSLGSVLRELYLDDCESIDPILMLPPLSKMEYLEVLSLAGLHTVCDDFISQLIALRGHKLKELVLADCVNLTDVSLKVISKSCTGICALDLTNLCKLTDSALGYLANGCQFIRSLKLRRNVFSDEAVAAYLEASGGSLEELYLNNVSKVAYNTAISLSKCSKNLQNLDLSFCRKLSNEDVGLIADSCLSLKTLKLFGCTQITDVFLDGHSNEHVQVIGLQMTPILGHIKVPELVGPLRYSSVSSV